MNMSQSKVENSYIELHVHTEYSILDAMTTVEEIAKYCSGNVCAITDHGNMYGVLKFQKVMKKAGKKSIIGIEAYTDSILKKDNKKSYHLVLLAKNNQGIKDLFKLSSESYNNFYRKPIMTWENIKKYSQNLVCLTACLGGELALLAKSSIEKSDTSELDTAIIKMHSIFKEDLYIEIQRHNLEFEKEINDLLIKKSKEFKIKIVATTDAHMALKEHIKAHQTILCINSKSNIENPKFSFKGSGYHLHTTEEMLNLFSDIKEAVYNTKEVADKCNAEIITGKYEFPKFEIPDKFKTQIEYLIYLAYKGFEKRKNKNIDMKTNAKKYYDRLEYEIKTIENMNFAGYFLIVWDFINYCHKNDILIGPGRGSAPGSLMMYCLGITNIDPLKYDLSFERFLNPDRITLPDIDTDFEHERRDEVIDKYIKTKYGYNCVSKIIKKDKLAAKASIKDVGKVFGISFQSMNKITKLMKGNIQDLINDKQSISIARNIMKEKTDDILEISQILENRTRQMGQHACGILIAPSEVDNYLPTCTIAKGKSSEREMTSQVTMSECEELGILKFDFLGLRTLTILKSVKNLVKKQGIDIDFENLYLNDVNVYKTLINNPIGIFQFESNGMQNLLKRLYSKIDDIKEDNSLFNNLIAAIALYRPGPIDEINNYITAMRSKIIYDTPELEPILKSTYGIFVYQEQIIEAVKKLAGFSNGQADDIRRAMGKKKVEIIEENYIYFIYGSKEYDKKNPESPKNIKGCIDNGIEEETAKMIWKKIKKFGEYAFNKSHATAYAVLAFQTAYCYTYYKIEYITSLLNAFLDDSKTLKQYIFDLKNAGISIITPKIQSLNKFSIIEINGCPQILYGISAISGIKTFEISEKFKNIKSDNINNRDIYEYLELLYSQLKNKSVSLAYVGVFDDYMNRKQAITMIEKFNEYKNKESKVGNLTWSYVLNKISFNVDTYKNPEIKEFPIQFILSKEKELLNNYISNHPTNILPSIAETIIPLKNVEQYIGKEIYIVCSIEEYEIKSSKNNKNYAVIIGEDFTASRKFICFNRELEMYQTIIENNKVVVMKVEIDSNEQYGINIYIKHIFVPKEEKRKKITFLPENNLKAKLFKDNVASILSFDSKNKDDVMIHIKYPKSNNIFLGYISIKNIRRLLGLHCKYISS